MASAEDTWSVLHSHLCAISLELHSAEEELSRPMLERLLHLVTRRGGSDVQELPRVAVVAVRKGRETGRRVFAPRAVPQRVPASWRQEREQPLLAIELPIQLSLRLQLPTLHTLGRQLGRFLLELASIALVTAAEAAVSAPVAAPASSSGGSVSHDRLVCASVDGFEASPQAIPMYLLEECIEHVEERVALDQLIINQTRMQHSQLAVRVARLEARQREVALEREARLAALDRENHLENRLNDLEALATSPWRTKSQKSFASTHDDGWFTAASDSTSPSEHGGDGSLLDLPASGGDAAQAESRKAASSEGSSARRTAGGDGGEKGAAWSESGSPGDTVGSSVGSASQSWVGRPAARIPAFLDSLPPTPCSSSPVDGPPDARGFTFPPSPQVRHLDASFLRRAQSTPASAMSAV